MPPGPFPRAAAKPPAAPPASKRTARQFYDRKTRSWTFEISIGMAEEILQTTSELANHPDPVLSRGTLAIDLLNPTDEMFFALYTNLRVLSAVMWVCLHEQAAERHIDLAEFQRSMDGPCLGVAKERFWEALQDFFPDLATSLQQLSSEQLASRAEVARRMQEHAPQRRRAILDVVDHYAQKELKDLQEAAARLTAEGELPPTPEPVPDPVSVDAMPADPTPADEPADGSPPSEPASPLESTGDGSVSGSSSSDGKPD